MILQKEDNNKHLEMISKDKTSIGFNTLFLKGQKKKKKVLKDFQGARGQLSR